jgi:hypothetical protein
MLLSTKDFLNLFHRIITTNVDTSTFDGRGHATKQGDLQSDNRDA